jgi:sec-independent protein translocase protein TatC
MSDSQEESFISHLVELRDRLLRSLIAIAVVLGILCFYPGPGPIYDILAAPLTTALPEGTKMVAIGVITPFMVPLKVTGMVAFVLALPYILFQAWAFIAPGLYDHEKRLGIPLIISSTLLFMLGMAFCYFFVFGQVFRFINGFAPKSITPAPDIEAYLSFVMTMFLAFGLSFEVPVALVVLVKLGVVTVEKLKEWRSYFIVGAFIVAAVVTPPDVVSQLALAIPMCLLYELGILASHLVSRPAEAAAKASPETE